MVALRNDMAASRGEGQRGAENWIFSRTDFYPCVVGKSRKVKTTPLLTSKFENRPTRITWVH